MTEQLVLLKNRIAAIRRYNFFFSVDSIWLRWPFEKDNDKCKGDETSKDGAHFLFLGMWGKKSRNLLGNGLQNLSFFV